MEISQVSISEVEASEMEISGGGDPGDHDLEGVRRAAAASELLLLPAAGGECAGSFGARP